MREGCGYYLPAFLGESAAVSVLACDDWGPATKLIPALLQELSPQTLILAVDDDTIYPPDLVANLLAWHERRPDAALGLRGWTLPASLDWHATRTRYASELDEPLSADVLTGTWGILVQPRFFDAGLRDYAAWPPRPSSSTTSGSADTWPGARVPRLIVPCRQPPLSTRLAGINGLFRQTNRDGHNCNVVIRAFGPYWQTAAGDCPLPAVPNVPRGEQSGRAA